MNFALIAFILFVSITIIAGFVQMYRNSSWNNGICRLTGNPWEPAGSRVSGRNLYKSQYTDSIRMEFLWKREPL